MKKLIFLPLILFLGISFSTETFSQDEVKKETKKTEKVEESADQTAADSKPVNTVCPVSTEDADPEITHTYNGKTYAVCCNKCLKKFKADPEKYISKLDADGNLIEKK